VAGGEDVDHGVSGEIAGPVEVLLEDPTWPRSSGDDQANEANILIKDQKKLMESMGSSISAC
jgi:hypothetical protein